MKRIAKNIQLQEVFQTISAAAPTTGNAAQNIDNGSEDVATPVG
jgi:hypothetical protein